jgi:hypothetical protein
MNISRLHRIYHSTTATVTIEQCTEPLLKIACFLKVRRFDSGTRPIIIGRNENLVQNQLFALTKLSSSSAEKNEIKIPHN